MAPELLELLELEPEPEAGHAVPLLLELLELLPGLGPLMEKAVYPPAASGGHEVLSSV